MFSAASVLTALVLFVAQAAPLLEEFHAADRYGKMRVVSESVLGKRPATDAQIQDLLAAAMKDPDVSVRAQAVGTVGTILTFSLVPGLPPTQDWTRRLRPVGEALLPALQAAADDPEGLVRLEALRGIVGWGAQGNLRAVLPTPVLTLLAKKFESDPSASIRSFAVGVMASALAGDAPEPRRLATHVLLRALEDPDPFVVQSAAHAATRARIPEALPLLVKQLKNPSHVARMGAAQGLASYREAARPYLPDLEAALAVEKDDITRKTLAGTITVIQR